MKLYQLLERLNYQFEGAKDKNIEISSLVSDNRKVTPGCMFAAVRGTTVDGHSFIPQAVENGAVAVVGDSQWWENEGRQWAASLSKAPSIIIVEDCNMSRALLASAWNGYPSEQLTLVGVTGTNGKTTIATLLYKLFTKLGYPCGLISTVCNYIIDRPVPANFTTPYPLELNNLLRQMVEAGCSFVFMEVSSHSVDQKRIGGLDFDGGIFTNLTRDHLDYHKTFENYLHAKKAFFDGLKKEAFALTNLDDSHGEVMLQNTHARRCNYSVRSVADYTTKIVEESFEGMSLLIEGQEVQTHFVGRFNASNLIAVYGAACPSVHPRASRPSSTMPTPPTPWSMCSAPSAKYSMHAARVRSSPWWAAEATATRASVPSWPTSQLSIPTASSSPATIRASKTRWISSTICRPDLTARNSDRRPSPSSTDARPSARPSSLLSRMMSFL